MRLKLYNTLKRKKEIFIPLKKGKVSVYTCGPTVYWYQHIGNLRSYINWDILKRVLKYNGFKVKHVMNVTDVGHLTSDADEGEDKVEKAASKEHKTASEITNFYLNAFKKDFEKLNILEPDIWCKATEHIQEQIDLVKKLEEKGYTYETSDGIYFDTSKVEDYGKLANLKTEELKGGKRISLKEKKNKTDFALWKFSKEPGKRQQEWDSPWGVGFPGWHIECSVMSSKYLGNQFDIHTGGEEHIPVHHTNEIAQSESAFGIKPWVRYWLHSRWLTFRGEKMSKSKGEIATISELQEQGFKPLHYRYFVLTGHYRTQLSFSKRNLKNAKNSYERLKRIVDDLKKDNKVNKNYLKKFEEKINDDLDMPKALDIMWEMLRDKNAEGKLKTLQKMDEVLGLELLRKEEIRVPEKIKKIVEERERTRKENDFKKADELREKIKSAGWKIDDTSKGPKLEKI